MIAKRKGRLIGQRTRYRNNSRSCYRGIRGKNTKPPRYHLDLEKKTRRGGIKPEIFCPNSAARETIPHSNDVEEQRGAERGKACVDTKGRLKIKKIRSRTGSKRGGESGEAVDACIRPRKRGFGVEHLRDQKEMA